MDYPKGLIRYSTENAMAKHWGWKDILGHVLRPRIMLYSGILVVITIALVWGLATKPTLRVDVIGDRGLGHEIEDGRIENGYFLRVMNITEATHRYEVTVTGLDKITLTGDQFLEVPPAMTKSFNVHVQAPATSGKKGANQIFFDVKDLTDEKVSVHEKATFLNPE
jgi:polyferredoxin